jgi:hypothetical protein
MSIRKVPIIPVPPVMRIRDEESLSQWGKRSQKYSTSE